jgi:hypothetical protein
MSVLINDERPLGEDEWRIYRRNYLDRLLECVAIAERDAETLSPEKYQRFGLAMTFELTIAAERAPPEYSAWFHEYLEGLKKQVEQPDRTWYGDHFNSSHTIDSTLSTWAWRRKFCTTTQGRFAWVPHDADVDDLLSVIRGARVPYVIRLRNDGNFTLICECWIQGLMEGEALRLPGIEWQEICLK